ncbi:MAG TPA: hypothetical protein PK228_09305 [Saprospiraceae bacterium]|nr:hypothetical protein [Saprospiraceae bacterium]
MGRINGTNSDYIRVGDDIKEDKSNPLYLKIYICPNDQLNSIEPPKDGKSLCIGTQEACPGGDHGVAHGHAMIHLHEQHGVEIVAGKKNRIAVKQNGDIELGKEDGAAKITLQDNGEIRIDTSTLTVNGEMKVGGNSNLVVGGDRVEMLGGNNNRILVKPNGDIELGKAGGAKITLTSGGAVIIDANTITINGNLGVNGDLSVTGNYPGK